VGTVGTDYGHGMIEERHLVLMAKNLANTVRNLSQVIQTQNPPWANDRYLQAIVDYT